MSLPAGAVTTTVAPTTQAPTQAPTSSPDNTTNTDNSTTVAPQGFPSPAEISQRFDGASFIGGIVLCAGAVAIVFFGCKFYKAKSERNYQTL